MQPHERLKAWELAHRLYLAVHGAARTWPRAERYELTSQVLRAAFSVPANIVEGPSRKGPREFRKALDIARGSLAELGYGLLAAKDLGYLDEPRWAALEPLREETSRVLWGLLQAVSKRC